MSRHGESKLPKTGELSLVYRIVSGMIALIVAALVSVLGFIFLLRDSDSLGMMALILIVASTIGGFVLLVLLVVPDGRRRQNQLEMDYAAFKQKFDYDPRETDRW